MKIARFDERDRERERGRETGRKIKRAPLKFCLIRSATTEMSVAPRPDAGTQCSLDELPPTQVALVSCLSAADRHKNINTNPQS